MQYRRLGKLDWEVSVLGFGAMRLPLVGKEAGEVDEPESIRMMRYAIDHGVNYIDTAYPYHEGHSEGIVGKALEEKEKRDESDQVMFLEDLSKRLGRLRERADDVMKRLEDE